MNRHLNEHTELHLSDEQLYGLLDDSADAASREHVNSCGACQSEVTLLRDSFAMLRDACTSYAALRTPALATAEASAARSTAISRRPIWAVSFASAALGLGVSVSLMRPGKVSTPAHPTVETAPATAAESDEALLEGIQRDLSTSVPPSLAPLEVSSATNSN